MTTGNTNTVGRQTCYGFEIAKPERYGTKEYFDKYVSEFILYADIKPNAQQEKRTSGFSQSETFVSTKNESITIQLSNYYKARFEKQ